MSLLCKYLLCNLTGKCLFCRWYMSYNEWCLRIWYRHMYWWGRIPVWNGQEKCCEYQGSKWLFSQINGTFYMSIFLCKILKCILKLFRRSSLKQTIYEMDHSKRDNKRFMASLRSLKINKSYCTKIWLDIGIWIWISVWKNLWDTCPI